MKKLFALLGLLFPCLLLAQNASPTTAGQLIEAIIKNTGASIDPKTVDIIKEGDAETPVTGIVTCMFATMDVLKKAVDKKCNLIIVHEPIYYNHLDKTEKFQNDSVFLTKKKYINDHNLVIWRFHDYIHWMQPDGVVFGMAEKLGWEKNKVEGNQYGFSFPQITLRELLVGIKKAFPENTINVVGDPSLKVSLVILEPGAGGSEMQIMALRDKNVQVMVAGEVPQWETYEYTRDAVAQGKKKAVVFLGHVNSEESGMKFAADWLKKFVKVPVYFEECHSSYWTY